MHEIEKTASSAASSPSDLRGPSASNTASRDFGSATSSWRRWWPYLTSMMLVGGALFISRYDAWLTHPDRVHQLPGDVLRLFFLTEFFAHGFGVVVLAAGIFMLAPGSRACIPRIAACALWPGLIAHLLKIQFARRRPIRFFDEFSVSHFPDDPSKTWLGWFHKNQWNYEYINQSFPSAHTATVWGLAIGMIWAFPQGRWLFIVIAAMASIQRVISYAHWPSDVLLGAAVAFFCAGALTQNWGLGWVLGQVERRLGRVQSTIVR